MEEFEPPNLWKRHGILLAIRAGRASREISEFFNISIRMVQNVRRELEDSGFDYEATAKRKTHRRRSDAVRTPDFAEEIQKVIDEDPSKSMRAIAREKGVDESVVRQVVHEDIRYFSYKMRKGQFLSQKMQEKRLKHAKKLLNKLKHPLKPNMLWFFSDEKNFCQDQKINSQNNRWLAVSPKDVPRVMQTKFPVTIMVFGVVSSEGDVMPPHFFPEGLRLDTDGYIRVLTEVVKPWIDRVAAGRPYVWQQDSAPCHTSRKTQAWLSENFDDHTGPEVWPPSSPDCNPLDFYVWGAVERDTNRSSCNTKDELKCRITRAFRGLQRETVTKACSRFRSRMEAVIDAGGGFIE